MSTEEEEEEEQLLGHIFHLPLKTESGVGGGSAQLLPTASSAPSSIGASERSGSEHIYNYCENGTSERGSELTLRPKTRI